VLQPWCFAKITLETCETKKLRVFYTSLWQNHVDEGAVGCLDRWLGQGRGARTPLGPWSGLREGPWRAHGVVPVLVVSTTKSAAVVATSQRSCSRSISRSATPNHVWSVACSICMSLSALIYSMLYWLELILWGKSAYFHKLSMKTTPQII
jgi:hypothetical protein